MIKSNKIYKGHALEVLKTFPDECIDMVITSPPYYGLRDYGEEGQLGLEKTFQEYLDNLIAIFNEVKRVLKPDGSCWVNLGDTYAGTMPKKATDVGKTSVIGEKAKLGLSYKGTKNQSVSDKSLIQIPSRFAIAMTDNGWILRNEIIWHKPNCMPSSVKDRFTVDFEKLFFFTKNKKYYFNQQKEPMLTDDTSSPRGSKEVIGQVNSGLRKQDEIGCKNYIGFNDRYTPPNDLMRNKRCVWKISTKSSNIKHFAMFPPKLIETPIKAGSPKGGIVLDPFIGSGTTALVCRELGRNYIGIDINGGYIETANKRINKQVIQLKLFDDEVA